jgi:hypothetical protein
MSHLPSLSIPLSHAPAAPAAGRTRLRRPGLAARGATLARMLLVPGAAAEILREIGDVPGRGDRFRA